MTSAVFDCMVFLQAATNDQGPAITCLAMAEAGEVQLHVSAAILAEVRDVLSRMKIRAKFPRLTPERIELFVQKLAMMAVLTNDVPDVGVTLRDPDDSPYLNLAISAEVAYLVSRDKDLLDLMKDKTFVDSYPRLQVVDPAAFLKAVGRARSP